MYISTWLIHVLTIHKTNSYVFPLFSFVAWFIAVQIMVTATLLCQIAGIIFLILYFLSIRDNAQLVTFSLTASTGLMFFSGKPYTGYGATGLADHLRNMYILF